MIIRYSTAATIPLLNALPNNVTIYRHISKFIFAPTNEYELQSLNKCYQKASEACLLRSYRNCTSDFHISNFIFQPLYIQKRFRFNKLSWPIDHLPFTWTRKEHKADAFKSGDLEHKIGPVDLSLPKAPFRLSEELETANSDVKKLFTLECASRKEIMQVKKLELLQKIQQHSVDFKSYEVRIAKLTLDVRRLQEHMTSMPMDKKTRAVLLKKIEKRNKYLKIMHHTHYERYKWLVKELGIDFKVPDLGVNCVSYTRKNELRRLTKEYTDKIRNDKLEKFHATLKAQQDSFLKEKEEAYKWIAEEEKSLGIQSDVHKTEKKISLHHKMFRT